MNRILVTGASGFIGQHTLKLLEKVGFEVHATNSSIDLLHVQRIRELLFDIKPTHLLHLAWLTTPGIFFESPDNIKWVEATLALVRSFTEAGGKRFVGAGTCFETLLPDPSASFYGFCKNSTRILLEKYCEKMGVEFSWGRIYFLYGPYERSQRLIPSVIRGILRGETVACSRGEQIRDYMYVEDCARCFVDLVNSQKTGIFDIASGQPIQLREFILAFAHALGRPDLIKLGERPEIPGEPQFLYSYTPLYCENKVNLEQGIYKTIEYWRREIS